MKLRPTTVLLTCEHGGNQVPADYRKLFAPYRELLKTHRGWDPGTKELADQWQQALGSSLHVATITRLLVDLNRSPNHRNVFSEVTRDLPASEKLDLLSRYHLPHRSQITEQVKLAVANGQRVLHVGIHSFTPVLNDEVRNAEVSLLYDPTKEWEANLCERWRSALRQSPVLPRVRLNYPYRGNTDGLTTTLRKLFPADSYAGIEIEVNQAIPLGGGATWRNYRAACIDSFSQILP